MKNQRKRGRRIRRARRRNIKNQVALTRLILKTKKSKRKKKKKTRQNEEENDPQELLKEITKGLNIDFVGGGSSNPFAMGNVKVKKEKLSDDESDKRRNS